MQDTINQNRNTQESQSRGLTTRVANNVFTALNRQAANHHMKLGDFVAYVLESFAKAVEPQLMGKL